MIAYRTLKLKLPIIRETSKILNLKFCKENFVFKMKSIVKYLVEVLVRRSFPFRRDVLLAAEGADATAPRGVVHLEQRRVQKLLRIAKSDT